MDNVQKHNICANVPLSQTFRSYCNYSTCNEYTRFLELSIQRLFEHILLYTYEIQKSINLFYWHVKKSG
jgi:hypothetical protein